MKKAPVTLRSARWFAPHDLKGFSHRSRIMQMGYSADDWVGKPVIAILNTWSDINPCHAHFKTRVDDVKRGVFQAGGFPIELPALSLSENFSALALKQTLSAPLEEVQVLLVERYPHNRNPHAVSVRQTPENAVLLGCLRGLSGKRSFARHRHVAFD